MRNWKALRRLAALVMLGGLGACSMLNPYRHAGVVTVTSESGVTDRAAGLDELGFGNNVTLAGGAYEAILELDRQRAALYGDLKSMAVSRSMAATVGVVTSVWGVYNALRPLEAGVTAQSTSDLTRSAQLAGVAGLSYGLHQYFVNPDQENVFAQGYNALTCLAAQSRPLLLAKSKGVGGQPASYDTLKADLNALKLAIESTSTQVERMAIGVSEAGLYGVPTDSRRNPAARQVGQARQALARARKTHLEGSELLSQVDKSGYAIRARTGLILGSVNAALRGTMRNVDATANMTQAKGIADSFRNIGKDSAEDADDENTTSAAPTVAPRLVQRAGPAFVRVSTQQSRTARLVSAVWRPDDAVAARAWRQVADVVPAPPAPAASAPVCKPPAKLACRVPAKRTVRPPQTEPAASSLELTTLQKLLQEPAVLEALVAKHQAEHQAAINKLKKDLQEAKEAAAKAKDDEQTAKLRSPGACVPTTMGSRQCDTAHLAGKVEHLYGLRRPVLQALVNFRQATKAVRSIENCNASLVSVRLTPDLDRVVKPGETVTFYAHLSNGQAPAVAVSSDAGKLTTEAVGIITKATVKIADDAANGSMELVASDPVYGARESVRLTIKKPVEPKPTAAQSAAAAASAAEKAASAAKTAAEAAKAAAEAAAKAGG